MTPQNEKDGIMKPNQRKRIVQETEESFWAGMFWKFMWWLSVVMAISGIIIIFNHVTMSATHKTEQSFVSTQDNKTMESFGENSQPNSNENEESQLVTLFDEYQPGQRHIDIESILASAGFLTDDSETSRWKARNPLPALPDSESVASEGFSANPSTRRHIPTFTTNPRVPNTLRAFRHKYGKKKKRDGMSWSPSQKTSKKGGKGSKSSKKGSNRGSSTSQPEPEESGPVSLRPVPKQFLFPPTGRTTTTPTDAPTFSVASSSPTTVDSQTSEAPSILVPSTSPSTTAPSTSPSTTAPSTSPSTTAPSTSPSTTAPSTSPSTTVSGEMTNPPIDSQTSEAPSSLPSLAPSEAISSAPSQQPSCPPILEAGCEEDGCCNDNCSTLTPDPDCDNSISLELQCATASSDFETGSEGWFVSATRTSGTETAIPEHATTGGNPNGHIFANDTVARGTWYWNAPNKFLGNREPSYGQIFRYDFRTSENDNLLTGQADVIIQASNGDSISLFDLQIPTDQFETYFIVLNEVQSTWRLGIDITSPLASEQDIRGVLSDVSAIQIRGEYQVGVDEGFLDNVELSAFCPGG